MLGLSMPLDNQMRGALEKIIDSELEHIPNWLMIFRDIELKKQLMLKDENEVVFGMVWGEVITSFLSNFIDKYKRTLSDSERGEMIKILIKRSAEIRNAILDAG